MTLRATMKATLCYGLFFVTLAIAGLTFALTASLFIWNFLLPVLAAILPNVVALGFSIQHARRLHWRSGAAWGPVVLNGLVSLCILGVLGLFVTIAMTEGFKPQM
jgi:hypothetical protein